MGKDARSTVSRRVECSRLGVSVLFLGVIYGVVVSGAVYTFSTRTNCALQSRIIYLLRGLHVKYIQGVDDMFWYTRVLICRRLGLTLQPCIDLISSEVNIATSERKVFKACLAGEDLPVAVGVRHIIDVGNLSSLAFVNSSIVDGKLGDSR